MGLLNACERTVYGANITGAEGGCITLDTKPGSRRFVVTAVEETGKAVRSGTGGKKPVEMDVYDLGAGGVQLLTEKGHPVVRPGEVKQILFDAQTIEIEGTIESGVFFNHRPATQFQSFGIRNRERAIVR